MGGKKRKDKRQDQIRHTIKRVKERFDLTITQGDVLALSRLIRDQDKSVTCIGRESCSRTHYILPLMGQEVWAVYDNVRHVVCTIMPLSWLSAAETHIDVSQIPKKYQHLVQKEKD